MSVAIDSAQPSLGVGDIDNISTGGLSFHGPHQLTPGDRLHLSLDLAGSDDTIETSARVTWSEASGRTGVRFRKMRDPDFRRLEQWLFANLLAACVKYEAAKLRPDTAVETRDPEPAPENATSNEYAAILITLGAIRQQIAEAEVGLESGLEILVEHARTLTCASGAAIAISTSEELVCRASSGSTAPSLGAHIGLEAGFTGECVRRRQLLRCDDTETDLLVDRESCRVLGVRSLMAVPVLCGDEVVGLLEVFSPHANAFLWKDEVYLRHLAGMILDVLRRTLNSLQANVKALATAAQDADAAPQNPLGFGASTQPNDFALGEPGPGGLPPDRIADAHAARFRTFSIAALVALAAISAAVITPSVREAITDSTDRSRPAAKTEPAKGHVPAAGGELEQLRAEAQRGDPTAQFALGARYAVGDEVAQDYREAAHWFTLAADQGYVSAQATLGAYYWLGRGVPKDLDKAYFWSVLAKAGGDEASKFRVPALASQLSRSAVIADQEQANQWIRDHQLTAKDASQNSSN